MNKSILFIISLCFLATISCSKNDDTPDLDKPVPEQPVPDNKTDPDYKVDYNPVHEVTENYDITYQYQEGVRVLNNVAQKYLINIESDSILYFLKSTPSNILPEEGMVVASKITEKTPFGLGNKVLSVTETDNGIKCVTTVADVKEIFQQLELTSQTQLSSLSTPYDNLSTRASLGSLELINIPLSIESPEGLFAELDLKIGGILNINLDLAQESYEVSLTSGVSLTGEWGVRYEYNKNGEEGNEVLLELIKRTTIFQGIIPIAGGVITLRPFVDFGLDIEGKLEGKVVFGMNQTLLYKAGWNENGYFNENLSEEDHDLFDKITIEGKFEAGPAATIGLGLGLWTKNVGAALDLKPNIMIGGELGVDLDDQNNRCLIRNQEIYVKGNIDIVGEVFIQFFNWKNSEEVTFTQIPLFSFTKSIFPPTPTLYEYILTEDPLSARLEFRFEEDSLIKYLYGTPTLYVELMDELVASVIDETLNWGETGKLVFNVEGLMGNTEYVLTPGIKIGNIFYYWKDYNFSNFESPSITIKDIQITRAHQYGENLYQYNVNMYIDFVNIDAMRSWEFYYSYYENGSYRDYSSGVQPFEGLHDGENVITKIFQFESPAVSVTFTPKLKEKQPHGPEPEMPPFVFNFIYEGDF